MTRMKMIMRDTTIITGMTIHRCHNKVKGTTTTPTVALNIKQ